MDVALYDFKKSLKTDSYSDIIFKRHKFLEALLDYAASFNELIMFETLTPAALYEKPN